MNQLSEIRELRLSLDEAESLLLTNYRRVRKSISDSRKAIDAIEIAVEREHQEVSEKLSQLRRRLVLFEAKNIPVEST